MGRGRVVVGSVRIVDESRFQFQFQFEFEFELKFEN